MVLPDERDLCIYRERRLKAAHPTLEASVFLLYRSPSTEWHHVPNLTVKSIPSEKSKRAEYLASLISACGLNQAEAAEILGIAHQSLRRKAIGERSVTDAELLALANVLDRIREGDVEGLPDGARRLAAALAFVKQTRNAGEQDAGREDDHED